MRIEMPYGARRAAADIDWVRPLATLDIAAAPEPNDPPATIRAALLNPIGQNETVFQRVRPGESVVLLVSDSFRETGVDQVLPVLLAGLNDAGVNDADISFLFATGVHRPPTPLEQQRILGPQIYARFRPRVYCHDAADPARLRFLGKTARGTPVWANRMALECDRLIATGSVMLHYFAGFGGGRKAVIPGVASIETIAHNHTLNVDPAADRIDPSVRIGVLDGNPVAEDLLEAARMVNVDSIINTVLNRNGRLAAVFAGDLEQAHRVAAQFARKMYTVPIREQADLVVASSGAARNFIQAHKALYNACQAMKPGGRVIFLAACPEGLGADRFAHWLRLGSVPAVLAELRKHGAINGQTALSTLGKASHTILVTDMPEPQRRLLPMRPARSLEEALEIARKELNLPQPSCYLMPAASYTVPVAL